MNPDLTKPIPKYILAKIQRLDKKRCPEQKGAARMYSYLTKINGELVKITAAVRNHSRKWYCKQVAAHGVKSEKCYSKDMEYLYFGMGFRIGWHAEGLYKYRKWYEDGKWYEADCKYYNPDTATVNPEYVGKFPEYRYSAYQYFKGRCIIRYLKLYEQYPQTEYLLKLGLHKLHDSVTVLKRVAKDKKFCRWLIAHKDEITESPCYVGAVMQAYKSGKSIKQIQAFAECKKKLDKDNSLRPLKELFGNGSSTRLERFFSYLEEQNGNPRSYLDYLNACNYLGLDMSLPKNLYPHNFKYWHDTRIEQYHAAKALADEKERTELYRQFATVAEKYIALQKLAGGKGAFQGYAVIIAASPAELLREGEVLNHCVGKMNYCGKMAREETLIFFVRSSLSPDIPFVTVEYSPAFKKVLQCYGRGNLKPDDTVLHYVNKIWLPFANKTLKKIPA